MTDTDSLGKLPHWDLDSIFPGLDSEPFNQAIRDVAVRLDDLDKFMAESQITPAAPASSDDKAMTSAIEGYLERRNASRRAFGSLRLYIFCTVAADSSNDLAQRCDSELGSFSLRFQNQLTLFKSWLGKQSAILPEVLSKSELAQAHALFLQETAQQSRYLMGDAEESLAAELASSGLNAWFKIHR